MPHACIVKRCPNISCKLDCFQRRVSFHQFPLKDKDLLAKWVANINKDSFVPKAHHKICSDHFEESCFNITKTGLRSIRKEAVPTLFNPRNEKKMKKKKDSASTSEDVEDMQIDNEAAEEIVTIKQEIIEDIEAEEIEKIVPEQIEKIVPEQLENIKQEKIENIKQEEIENIEEEEMVHIKEEQLEIILEEGENVKEQEVNKVQPVTTTREKEVIKKRKVVNEVRPLIVAVEKEKVVNEVPPLIVIIEKEKIVNRPLTVTREIGTQTENSNGVVSGLLSTCIIGHIGVLMRINNFLKNSFSSKS